MKERILSTIVMLLIFVPIVLIGGMIFNVFSLILGNMVLFELLKNNKYNTFFKVLTHILTSFIIMMKFNQTNLSYFFDFRILLFLMIIYLSLLVFINDQEKYNYKDAFYLIAVTLFVSIAFINLIQIRYLGLESIIYLFLITTMSDTFALLTGKVLGRHKMVPKISPNKTIEGFLGGCLFGTIIPVIFYINFIGNYNNILIIILLTLFLSIIGQLGDLIKSSIKRYENIKDFSNLIPGHGGIFDRLDSIIFVMMTYILISSLF